MMSSFGEREREKERKRKRISLYIFSFHPSRLCFFFHDLTFLLYSYESGKVLRTEMRMKKREKERREREKKEKKLKYEKVQ